MSAVAVRTVVDAVAMSTVVRTVAVLLHVEAVCCHGCCCARCHCYGKSCSFILPCA